MAKLVGVYASSHAPLIIRGWKDVRPANREDLTSALTELGRRIKAARPDVLIEIAPDHWVNFFINNLPSICVGMGEEHDGPAEPWMKDCPFKKIAGHPQLAIVPIIFNDLEPPYPSVRRCLHWGTMLSEAVRTYPEDIRVAVLATGGLSHS